MDSNWRTPIYRTIAIIGPIILLVPLIYVAWFLINDASEDYQDLVLRNYLIFFGMPYAAFFAYVLVVSLEMGRGDIEVEMVGFKFKGAAGPLVFWLLIFLSIQLGFKLFWVGLSS